jgi:hypothetical protein
LKGAKENETCVIFGAGFVIYVDAPFGPGWIDYGGNQNSLQYINLTIPGIGTRPIFAFGGGIIIHPHI